MGREWLCGGHQLLGRATREVGELRAVARRVREWLGGPCKHVPVAENIIKESRQETHSYGPPLM